MEEKKLNIGSSVVHLNGWLNLEYNEQYWVDAQKGAVGWGEEINELATRDMPDVFGDVLDLHQFEDNTFDLIRSAHVLEHIHPKKTHQALREQFRVLKSGGWCRVIVPSLDILLDRYNKRSQHKAFWDKQKNDPGLYMDSELKKPYDNIDEAFIATIHLNGEHLNSFTRASLIAMMKRVGFVSIQGCDADEQGIPDSTVIEYSLRLKGKKP
jgi:predicted SAM-dependent methyltransferase